jgi:hypothetical protein
MTATVTLPVFQCRSSLCVLRVVALMGLWVALVAGFVFETWPAGRTAPHAPAGTKVEATAVCPAQPAPSHST